MSQENDSGAPVYARPPAGGASAGWYPNPTGEGERYWDGTEWTWRRHREPKGTVTTSHVVMSYIAAMLFPPLGLFAGIWLLAHRRIGHGIAVIVFAIGWGIVLWNALATSPVI